MSKPASIYGGRLRLYSPACALLGALRCLAASQVAPPVHGVFTTRATTPRPRLSAPADWTGRRSGVAARYHLSSPWPITMRSAAPLPIICAIEAGRDVLDVMPDLPVLRFAACWCYRPRSARWPPGWTDAHAYGGCLDHQDAAHAAGRRPGGQSRGLPRGRSPRGSGRPDRRPPPIGHQYGASGVVPDDVALRQ
jgi:hypothetical protein